MHVKVINIINTVLIILIFPALVQSQSFCSIYEKGSCEYEVDQIIGGDVDDDNYFFYQPSDLALDGQANLFVLDQKGFCIKKYNSDGVHLGTFSRHGEGPGEMQRGYRIAVDVKGNVTLYDMSLRRISYFNNAGQFTDSIELTELGNKFISNFSIDNKGHFYA